MTTAPPTRPDPLFLGDHPAMDFLNSVAGQPDGRTEWLADGPGLADWLARAGLVEDGVAATFLDAPDGRTALDAAAGQARDLREWLRAFVRRHAGSGLTADAAAELDVLNGLLADADSHLRVEAADEPPFEPPSGLRLRRVRRWTAPRQLLHPLAEAIGDLVAHADFRLIRTCEGPDCTLMFLDRTKSHARRWCSMALCGNRAKVAAHRARVRDRRA
ncbi:CGNR zinc finger domain-containing protein [Arenibaculum sp.]|jgi:predicted RNA-binding Zn ribbon-like protein|uniref:CGNR zinc finger domain-containing protein n=1 Tax=Arenibaculum sp. TaxID=2865862 RepID=UPI002E137257|nr:CGNR zinc finger domain-containing protein [Arenibaculum sp.]